MYYAVYNPQTADGNGRCTLTQVGQTADLEAIQNQVVPLSVVNSTPCIAIESAAGSGSYSEPGTYPGAIDLTCRYHPDQGVFYTSDGRKIREHVPTPPVTVPAAVSKLWFLRTLRTAGLEASVLAVLNAEGNEAKLRDWNAAAQISRVDADLIAVSAALGITSAAVDQLFITAAREGHA